MLKRTLLLLTLASCSLADMPRLLVVQATSLSCALLPTSAGECRPAVVVVIDERDPNERFIVGLRYMKDGVEMLESRQPVPAGSTWFYLDDVKMLSATAGSLKTGEGGIWFANGQ